MAAEVPLRKRDLEAKGGSHAIKEHFIVVFLW